MSEPSVLLKNNRQSRQQPVGSLRFWASLTVVLLILGWDGWRSGTRPPGGIALSFDDRSIRAWYEMRPLLNRYGAKVTFYITQADSLSGEEAAMLAQLRRDGHEVGDHGAVHTNSIAHVKAHSMESYLDNEIRPSIRSLQKLGFQPTTFAHPGGAHTTAIDAELLTYYRVLRDVSMLRRDVRGITVSRQITDAFEIYYPFDGDRTVYSLLIDKSSELTLPQMRLAIQKAYRDRSVLLLMGHKPTSLPASEDYGFDIRFLEQILAEAHRTGLRFYTMSELVEPESQNSVSPVQNPVPQQP